MLDPARRCRRAALLELHFCIGYQLARAEIVTGSRQLLDALPRPRLASGSVPKLEIDWFHRRLDQLVIENG